jgi:predicted nucleic acid-binding protein
VILVDTSVWVGALRRSDSKESVELRSLLDGDRVGLPAPVRIEILGGARAVDHPRLKRLLSALPLWLPEASTWNLMETWTGQAVRAGERFGLGDLLIAAIAAERGAETWSVDHDFERMERLGWTRLYRPGGGSG